MLKTWNLTQDSRWDLPSRTSNQSQSVLAGMQQFAGSWERYKDDQCPWKTWTQPRLVEPSLEEQIISIPSQLETINTREKSHPDTCWRHGTWPRTPGEILPLEPPIRMITGPEWAAWFWQRNMCHWNTRTKPRLMVHLMSMSDFKYQEKGWSRWLLKTGNPSWDVRWVFKFQTQHQNASTGLECAACYWHWHWGSM